MELAPQATPVALPSAVASAAATPVPVPAPTATTKGHASRSPPPSRSTSDRPASPASPAKPGCEPPFYFDSQGNRVFKKECL